MMVATRAKPDEIVPELSVQKRVLLYCIASSRNCSKTKVW